MLCINLNNYSKQQTNDHDSLDRAYKVKNLLKDLPIYAKLFKRGVNMKDSEICIRCEKEAEDWDHVWTCEANDILIEKSSILLDKTMNGNFYNNRFNKISNDKEEKKVIFNLWVYHYNQLKVKIWIKRCEEVVEIERKRGIGKKDKRVRKDTKEGTNNNNYKQKRRK
ncbi:hypothetical protein C1646_767297 [Rhizophagus diaphanus]|nr:hypothetical protein C1646_767297 [Rhizophagus diaphanus] [Rhizophagus sp. MUCL 43196]